ncbi:hypothetical protein BDW71DRAFT_174099 [Aspergillus fruticulosus]
MWKEADKADSPLLAVRSTYILATLLGSVVASYNRTQLHLVRRILDDRRARLVSRRLVSPTASLHQRSR